ncbi:hypothetical protein [Falsiroseomonas sp. CW058]|uniref:hypothetical protein n=1 Tax=Falsiroseomonas sp. CW058 TaxID=3388664 RepID=UPI003D31FB8F
MDAEARRATPAAEARDTSRGEAERRAAPEPATPRALWPTFLRRTLAEEALRDAALPARPHH